MTFWGVLKYLMGNNSIQLFLLPFWSGVCFKRKSLLSMAIYCRQNLEDNSFRSSSFIWAAPSQNVSSGICRQWRRRSGAVWSGPSLSANRIIGKCLNGEQTYRWYFVYAKNDLNSAHSVHVWQHFFVILAMLNKLRCHAHSVSQSDYLI